MKHFGAEKLYVCNCMRKCGNKPESGLYWYVGRTERAIQQNRFCFPLRPHSSIAPPRRGFRHTCREKIIIVMSLLLPNGLQTEDDVRNKRFSLARRIKDKSVAELFPSETTLHDDEFRL
jgi:hypothetical protein